MVGNPEQCGSRLELRTMVLMSKTKTQKAVGTVITFWIIQIHEVNKTDIGRGPRNCGFILEET